MTLVQYSRFEWIRNNVNGEVLDVGCGDSAYFDDTDIDFVGLDQDYDSPDMQGERPENFVHGDAQDLQFEDDSFDTVITAEVLEHLDNPIAALSEARRVAREKVIITVPDESRWQEEANPGEHEDHKRVYSGSMLFDQCVRAGFEERNVKIDHLNELPFAFWLAQCEVSD